MQPNGLTTIAGAIAYLDLSRTRLYQLMKEGDLPYIQLPGPRGRRRIRWADLYAMVRKMRRAGK